MKGHFSADGICSLSGLFTQSLIGWEGEGHICTNIDECVVDVPCDVNANCTGKLFL